MVLDLPVADLVAVAKVADADRVVDFVVAAESIGSVIVTSGFDTEASAVAVVVAAAASAVVIAISDCILGCSE